MSKFRQLTGHMMRTRARLHHHGARMEISEKFDHLRARKFLAKNHPSLDVLTMKVKRSLTEIDPYKCYGFHGGLLEKTPY